MKSNTIRCGYYVWPPFFSVDLKTKKMGGIGYDVTEEMAKQLGLKVEWVAEVQIDTMFEGYRNGKFDMICPPNGATPSRTRVSDFTIPIAYLKMNLYAQIDDKRFDHQFGMVNNKDVRYAALDGELGSIIAQDLFPLVQKVDVLQAGGNTNVLMQIATSKADVAVVEAMTAMSFINNNPGKIRLVEGGAVRAMPLNISIPLGEEKLKSMINITLQSLIADSLTALLKNIRMRIRGY
jgi:ABC-type amino acid transport substrate-binding protein